MNLTYLMDYISRHLHTYIRHYTKDLSLSHEICARKEFEDTTAFSIVQPYLFSLLPAQLPLIVSLNKAVYYSIITTSEGYYIVGPITLNSEVYVNLNLNMAKYSDEWLSSVFTTDFDTFLDSLLLIHNLNATTPISEGEVILSNCSDPDITISIKTDFSNLMFQRQEYGKQHNPYDQEIREFTSIEYGDITRLKESWAEDYIGTIGILSKDQLRHYKNLGIVLVTLASRAAIRGGMIPEQAFSLSDSYICKIDECKSVKEAYYLARQSEYEYAHLVHNIRSSKPTRKEQFDEHPCVIQCKDYIFKHLHEKIYLSEIAEELHINVNYLSEIFKKSEGLSIGSFILNEKVNLVKNMLTYSRYSYIEIASYLGFSSQSHLGQQFKKVTGMTLRQYRNKYGVQEFGS